MAYVDHAFSISDEDIMMDTDSIYTLHNKPPIKEITLAVSLLVFGVTGIIGGIFMAVNRVGGDTAHGLVFAVLGAVLFIPGFYYTRLAYYAYKGYKGVGPLFFSAALVSTNPLVLCGALPLHELGTGHLQEISRIMVEGDSKL